MGDLTFLEAFDRTMRFKGSEFDSVGIKGCVLFPEVGLLVSKFIFDPSLRPT